MTKRRVTTLIAAAVLVPGLSSCMNYATEQLYTPAAGVNERQGEVDILNAAIVSVNGSTGRFIATLSNGDTTEAAALEEVAGAGDDGTLSVADFEPVEIAPRGLVNLASTQVSAPGVGIPVAGDFGVGDFVEVSLTFADGTTETFEVPVLPNAGDYAGIAGSEETDLEREVPEDTFLLEEGHGGGHSEGGE